MTSVIVFAIATVAILLECYVRDGVVGAIVVVAAASSEEIGSLELDGQSNVGLKEKTKCVCVSSMYGYIVV